MPTVNLEEDEILACLTALEYLWEHEGDVGIERDAHAKLSLVYQDLNGWNGTYTL